MKRIFSLILAAAFAASPVPAAEPLPTTCYLFSYFTGNGEDGLHLAWSRDGFRWEALNGGKSFLKPEVGESKLMRDPQLLRGPDGVFHLVWTTSWGGVTIGHATSKDMLEWSAQKALPVMEGVEGVKNCWAPEAEWDPQSKQFVIFWASTVKGKFPETLGQAESDNNHRMWFTTTKDFQTLAPAKVWLDPGFNVIDATFLKAADGLRLIVKDETVKPPKKHLRMIEAKGFGGPFGAPQAPFSRDWVEGPTCLQVGDEWVVYYDCYREGHYGAIRSKDFKTWEDVTGKLSMPKGLRHGTAIAVPAAVVAKLLERDAAAAAAASLPVKLTVRAGSKGARVEPTMHGLFFEDINYAADGGLYAELIENRSFEHGEGMYAWSVVGQGTTALEGKEPIHPNNPRFLRLLGLRAGGDSGIANGGFRGIALKEGADYRFSVHARKGPGYAGDGMLSVRLEDEGGKVLAEGKAGPCGNHWSKLQLMLRATATTTKGRLVVTAAGAGALDLDMVSLFPKDTWKGRENGMRADLAQVLADMKPGFLRFPGGCIVEGKDLANAYRWKDTVGPVEQRKQNWNRWQSALRPGQAPHYYQTYGLGFFEFFQLCEDLGCEPAPVLNCGMSCQYQDKQLVPVGDLDPWVQDVLDLIEFANGPVSSKWGKLRADMGHPAPFEMKMVGVGNEQWDKEYFERYGVFEKAIRAKYPQIKIISTAGPGVDDGHWKFAWQQFRSGVRAEIVDEHYYRPPEWFLANHARYDKQDRKGPKVFVGEFAGHEKDKASTLRAALAEAVCMTGLVRNADLVVMASYAPLLAKAGDTQWTPDLIWFDNTRVHLTPSYHAQAMFSRNRPDVVVEVGQEPRVEPQRLFVSAGLDLTKRELIVHAVNPSEQAVASEVVVAGMTATGEATCEVLTSGDLNDRNSFEEPAKVAPARGGVMVRDGKIQHQFPARSLTVLRIPAGQYLR